MKAKTEKVDRNPRRRAYGVRDKEEIIKTVQSLYNMGYSLVDIAKITNGDIKLNRKYDTFSSLMI